MSHLNNAYMASLQKRGIGSEGKSAYEVWVEQPGNTGKTPEQFFDQINAGKSAYEVWLEQPGNTGKELDEFFTSISAGKSAYEVWLEQPGNAGKAPDEFFTSISAGKSAYEIWAEQPGNTGSEADFVEQLTGKSAYEIWLDHGNSGSESDFINYLKAAGFEQEFDSKQFIASLGQTNFDIGKTFAINSTAVFLNSSLIRSWSKNGNNITINTAQEGDIVDVFLFGGSTVYGSLLSLEDTPNEYIANKPVKVNSDGSGIEFGGISANDITSGILSIDRLPAGAVPVLHIVADEASRFALTHPPVNKGDTVKQEDTGEIYYVINETNLNSASGYEVYSASVDWNSITGKPSTFAPSSHNNTSHSVNYAEEARQVIAGTGLTGGGTLMADRTLNVSFGTTSTTACAGNDSRLDADRTRKTTISTSEPSGGADGDVWMKY